MAVLSDVLAFVARADAPPVGAALPALPALPHAAQEQQPSGALPAGGATLHHALCGCPASWRARERAADAVDALVQRCAALYSHKLLAPTRPLRVAYALPHHNVTGGMKCLVEHIRLLRARGHFVIAVHRSASARSAMPPWADVRPDADVLCNLHQQLSDVWDVSTIDVVVVGIFHQVAELLASVPAPVVYWEQGHEWLFGDPVRFQVAQNYLKQDQLFHAVMQLPCALAGVSAAVQALLAREFGRSALLVPNGIDCTRFTPGARLGGAPSRAVVTLSGVEQAPVKSVLLVGNPGLPLKGFTTALAVLAAVGRLLPLTVRWVCQQAPSAATVPNLATCGVVIECVVAPSQDELPALYRGHDALLFTSRYEAWGMPVLEAMASGLPVVTTACFGPSTFATHGVDCLMADVDDVAGLSRALLAVLAHQELAQRLAAAARATALRFTPAAVAEQLEAVLYSLTAATEPLLALRQAALPAIAHACALAAEACCRPPAAGGGVAGAAGGGDAGRAGEGLLQ